MFVVFSLLFFFFFNDTATTEIYTLSLHDALPISGARRTDRRRCGCPDRRRPSAHRLEGASPCLLPGGARARPYAASRRRRGLAIRPAPRPPLQPLLCRPDGDPPGHRGHGPARDGCRGGSDHRRTPRTGRRARRASHRGRRRRGRIVSGRASSRARIMPQGILGRKETAMAEDFEYISQARLEYRDGYRHAYLGEVAEPVVYGVQGALREYYGAKEGPPIASTLDHIVAAVAG